MTLGALGASDHSGAEGRRSDSERICRPAAAPVDPVASIPRASTGNTRGAQVHERRIYSTMMSSPRLAGGPWSSPVGLPVGRRFERATCPWRVVTHSSLTRPPSDANAICV